MVKLKKLIYKSANGFTILPFTFGVNIINKCNRFCSFCLYRSRKLEETPFLKWLYAQPDYMNVQDFERFMKRLGIFRLLINNVGLVGKGEPLLHPDFIGFCDVLDIYKIRFSVTTNGDFIEIYIHRLSKYKYLKYLRISIYSRKDYDNLKYLKVLYSNMDIDFYNMTGTKIDGISEGIKLWAKGLDENTVNKDFNKIKTCTKPFSYLSLNPDGTIVFCNSYYEIGTWNDHILKILNSKKSRNFRKGALKMNVENADCLNCGFNHNFEFK